MVKSGAYHVRYKDYPHQKHFSRPFIQPTIRTQSASKCTKLLISISIKDNVWLCDMHYYVTQYVNVIGELLRDQIESKQLKLDKNEIYGVYSLEK